MSETCSGRRLIRARHHSGNEHSFVVAARQRVSLREIFKQTLRQTAFNPVQFGVSSREGSTVVVNATGSSLRPSVWPPGKPLHKGRWNGGAPYLRNNAHQRLRSLAEENLFLKHLKSGIADKRIHDTTRKQVAGCFEEESPHLQPLPQSLFCLLARSAAYCPSGVTSIGRKSFLRNTTRIHWARFKCAGTAAGLQDRALPGPALHERHWSDDKPEAATKRPTSE
jgi:hypothetical protein